jgi:uncharacterized protein with HEPN domain
VSRERGYLEDLLAEMRLLESFTADGEQSFYADERTQYAVMMAYARIGEIAKRLLDDLLALRPEAEWREVKGFRDVLLHRYAKISPRRVWEATRKLPTLKAAAVALLEMLPADTDGEI